MKNDEKVILGVIARSGNDEACLPARQAIQTDKIASRKNARNDAFFAVFVLMAVLWGGLQVFAAQPQPVAADKKEASADQKAASDAGEAKKEVEEETFTVETVSGEVSGIAKDSIAIIYNTDYDTGTECEILIPIDKNTGLKHKSKLSEIKAGDLVSVEYARPAEGNKKAGVATTITFIQTGVVIPAGEAPPEEAPADSEMP